MLSSQCTHFWMVKGKKIDRKEITSFNKKKIKSMFLLSKKIITNRLLKNSEKKQILDFFHSSLILHVRRREVFNIFESSEIDASVIKTALFNFEEILLYFDWNIKIAKNSSKYAQERNIISRKFEKRKSYFFYFRRV